MEKQTASSEAQPWCPCKFCKHYLYLHRHGYRIAFCVALHSVKLPRWFNGSKSGKIDPNGSLPCDLWEPRTKEDEEKSTKKGDQKWPR